MPLIPANQSQLIRSSQKDEYYQSVVRNNANEAFQTIAGETYTSEPVPEKLFVYNVCVFFGPVRVQAVAGLEERGGAAHRLGLLHSDHVLRLPDSGEEYVNILQVDPSQRRVPSVSRRSVFVLCHCLVPYLLERVLQCVERELQPEPEVNVGARQLRVTGPSEDDSTIRTSYGLLGALSLLQLLLTVTLQLNSFRQRQRARHERNIYRNLQNSSVPGHVSSRARCILCLEQGRTPQPHPVVTCSAGTVSPSGARTGQTKAQHTAHYTHSPHWSPVLLGRSGGVSFVPREVSPSQTRLPPQPQLDPLSCTVTPLSCTVTPLSCTVTKENITGWFMFETQS
ncbi:hypothetical protein WMY93_033826 [Mugilogobius chulae]|uniref:RING-type E3 ubiquitin transferase n=1 Tax=Mugilogobius chulae TaxID=88201 RepID=A0AAW0MS22_9GOBI